VISFCDGVVVVMHATRVPMEDGFDLNFMVDRLIIELWICYQCVVPIDPASGIVSPVVTVHQVTKQICLYQVT
jgi:hypothetical protein